MDPLSTSFAYSEIPWGFAEPGGVVLIRSVVVCCECLRPLCGCLDDAKSMRPRLSIDRGSGCVKRSVWLAGVRKGVGRGIADGYPAGLAMGGVGRVILASDEVMDTPRGWTVARTWLQTRPPPGHVRVRARPQPGPGPVPQPQRVRVLPPSPPPVPSPPAVTAWPIASAPRHGPPPRQSRPRPAAG